MTGGNLQRGQLTFEVGDQRYTFAFSTNALCQVEDEFELGDISELGDILTGKPSVRTVRKLFRIGLTDCMPDLTDADAGTLIDDVGGVVPAVELVGRAVQAAFPEAAASGSKGPRKPAVGKPGRGNGRRSTATGVPSAGTPSSSGG